MDGHSNWWDKNSANQNSFFSEAVEALNVFITYLPNYFYSPNPNPPHPPISINSFWET